MTREAKKEPFIVFGAPDIQQAEIDEVVATLKSGWIGTGPRVARFERDFAAYKGVDQAAAVNSCTAALHLSLLAAGIGPGDEVITTPLTFCATINAIIHAGATPVLADVDPQTMNIDPEKVNEAVTSRTKALLPVHFAGRPCEMDALMDIAEDHELKVIEDCAHAIETEYKGRKAGTFGDFGCFSFYVTKNVVTGEGGMVLAKEKKDLDRIKTLALHGMSKDAWKRFSDEGYKHYDVVEAGFKYNMTDMQAALGIHQLARVETAWKRRQALWRRYTEQLAGSPAGVPAAPADGTRHGYHLYTIIIDPAASGMERDVVLEKLTRAGVGVGVHYRSMAEHRYYSQRFGWAANAWPIAHGLGENTLSVPFSAGLSDTTVDRITSTIATILGGGSG